MKCFKARNYIYFQTSNNANLNDKTELPDKPINSISVYYDMIQKCNQNMSLDDIKQFLQIT